MTKKYIIPKCLACELETGEDMMIVLSAVGSSASDEDGVGVLENLNTTIGEGSEDPEDGGDGTDLVKMQNIWSKGW